MKRKKMLDLKPFAVDVTVPTGAIPTAEGFQTLPGGSLREEIALPYFQIPPVFLRRLASRFRLGAEKYGSADQWKASAEDFTAVNAWATDAYNHIQDHLLSVAEGRCDEDHLAAIAWGVSVLMYAEQYHGMKSIFKVR